MKTQRLLPLPTQPPRSGRAGWGCSALAGWGVVATAARPVGRRGLRGPPCVPPAGFYAPIAGRDSSGVTPAWLRVAAPVT